MKTIIGGYEQAGNIYRIELLKNRMQQLKIAYENTLKEFDIVCDELDMFCKNQQEVEAKSVELTVLMSYMEDLETKMKRIMPIIENLKSELQN